MTTSFRPLRVAAPLSLHRHAGGPVISAPLPPLFALVELDEDLAASQSDGTAETLNYDDGAEDEPWSADAPSIAPLADANVGLLLAGERRLCYFHPGAGRFVPLPQVQVHLAIASEAIPSHGSGDVKIQSIDGDKASPTAHTVTAHDWLGHSVSAGEHVYVVHHQQSRRWYLITKPPEWITFEELDEVLETYDLIDTYEPSGFESLSNDDAAGDIGWNAAAGAGSSDDAYADLGLLTAGTTSQYLQALELSDYTPEANFAPKVVYLTVERRDPLASGHVRDSEVKLVINGAVQPENAARGEPWSADDATVTYRFTPELSRAESLAADFGAVVRVEYDGATSEVAHLEQEDWTTQIVAEDYDFFLGDDTTSGGPPAFAASAAGGGTPGTCLQLESSVTDGDTTWLFAVETTTPWTPAEDGPLSTVSFAASVNAVSVAADAGPQLILFRWAIRQSGVVYFAEAGGRIEGAGWDSLTADDLVAGDFTRESASGPAAPDFSATSAPIEFGIACGVKELSIGGGSGQFVARVDNLEINLRTGDAAGRAEVDHVKIRITGV